MSKAADKMACQEMWGEALVHQRHAVPAWGAKHGVSVQCRSLSSCYQPCTASSQELSRCCLRHTCTQQTSSGSQSLSTVGAADADALERSFLQQEFLTVKMDVKARVDKAQNVTVSLDAWPDTTGRYVFCCTVALPDRSALSRLGT